MRVMLEQGALVPKRAHNQDAGLDLFTPVAAEIPAGGSAVFDTGVHVELPRCSVGMIKSRSGMNILHGLLCEGVIDEGYTGSITVKLYNHSSNAWRIKRGDKIAQLVILPIMRPNIEIVDKLEATDRGDNGFGSTGR